LGGVEGEVLEEDAPGEGAVGGVFGYSLGGEASEFLEVDYVW